MPRRSNLSEIHDVVGQGKSITLFYYIGRKVPQNYIYIMVIFTSEKIKSRNSKLERCDETIKIIFILILVTRFGYRQEL